MTAPPLVFISHSSDDKQRFVLSFAAKLRANGIDAWVDKWEILPGDSLVQKLFADGLQPATAVIVVLSNASVASKWVREEINYGFVKRVTEGSRLIPVIIDSDVEVPPELRSTAWHKVKNLDSIDEDVARVVDSIMGQRSAPPIGAPPPYISEPLRPSGMTAADWFVLDLAATHHMTGATALINVAEFLSKTKAAGLSDGDAFEAVEILHGRGQVRLRASLGQRLVCYSVTASGFGAWLRATRKDHDQLYSSVVYNLVNSPGMRQAEEVAAAVGQEPVLVNYVFEDLESRGLVKLRKSIGPRWACVFSVSPELRRSIQ